MKKFLIALLACVVSGVAVAAPTGNTKKTGKAEFLIIESDEYAAGKEDPQLTMGIAKFLEVEPNVTRLTPAKAAENAKLKDIKYDFLPLYLIKKTEPVRTKMDQYLKQGYFQETADYIVMPHQTRQGVYMNKTAKKNVMDLFVMAQCPYGVRAENFVIQAKKDGKFPSGKTLNLHYIVDYNQARGFNSMHGSGEWEEAVRQLLIAKYYPGKFWKYLEIRNKDYRSSRWDKAMEEAGVDMKKILSKFDTEGLELLKKEAAYAKEFGVSASPTIIWEGKVQMDLGSASKLEGFGFFNPGQASGVAAPAGSC